MLNKNHIFPVLFMAAVLLPASASIAVNELDTSVFAGQDLYISGKTLVNYQQTANKQCFVFSNGFSMSVGGNIFSAGSAVLWLEGKVTDFRGRSIINYDATCYLTGNIVIKKSKNASTVRMTRKTAKDGRSQLLSFEVTGEVFITADKREESDPSGTELYKKAESEAAAAEPRFIIQKEALVPQPGEAVKEFEKTKAAGKRKAAVPKIGFLEKFTARQLLAEGANVRFMYPVNIGPVEGSLPTIESAPTDLVPVGVDAATVIGRFYLWQKQDESGRLLELQADNAVIFYSNQQGQIDQQAASDDILPKRAIKSVYLSGDVILTEDTRTIRADQIYYDFEHKSAIAVNVSMRTFDVSRGIPIYIRAKRLRELSESRFLGEDVTITSSEFFQPQISATAEGVIVTDKTVEKEKGAAGDKSYEIQMHNVQAKLDNHTFFAWPYMRSDLERPDMPIKSVRVGHYSDWGTSLETEWYFARLLGLQEPQGVKSTLSADYYGRRGPGAGAQIDYNRDTYYGRILGYIINDRGEDDLGKDITRKDIEPGKDTRGRLSIRHRQFLPYDWQLTTEYNYSSDETFIEEFYRGEYNTFRPETYVHLQRIEDNRALSILGKWRANDFEDTLQEMPTVEYHSIADSIFHDTFTLYTDIQVSRLQQKVGDGHSISIDKSEFSFFNYRTELDLPLKLNTVKVVPYLAGTFGYDDRSGFNRSLVDGSDSGQFGEDDIWIGEAGVRIFPQPLWKVYPAVKSRLWDLDQLRHIIQPSLTAVLFQESDKVVDQPDILNLSLSQRLQTKRGPVDNKETVDWMGIDTDFVWVEGGAKASDSGPGPDRFLWAKPIVPLRIFSAPQFFSGDLAGSLHRFELYGPQRDYFSTDYFWHISDTTSLLGDGYYDMESGSVQQFDIGFSRLCWPNLTYYIGSRYLKRTDILGQKGTNPFTFAATYVLDPRYTIVFAQQYDFDYGSNVRSDVTLIRKYHRISCAFTVSVDNSIGSQAVLFSIWPEGVKEMAVGDRRYIDIGGYPGN